MSKYKPYDKSQSTMPSDWPISVWDGEEFTYISRQRIKQLMNPEAEHIRRHKYEHSEKRRDYKRTWWQANKHRYGAKDEN